MLRVALEINYRFLGQIRTVIETFAFHCGFGSYSQGRIKAFDFDSLVIAFAHSREDSFIVEEGIIIRLTILLEVVIVHC